MGSGSVSEMKREKAAGGALLLMVYRKRFICHEPEKAPDIKTTALR